MIRRQRLVVGLLLAALILPLGLVLSHRVRGRVKAFAVRVVDKLSREKRRRQLPPEEPPLQGLSASQVGYGPAMRKSFTSPRPFQSFVVEDATSGAVVWRGGAPSRGVPTDLLGSVRTVWLGDFSPLHAPGRYRLRADNGLTSRPFPIGAQVFDAPLRAVQRWFYYQRAFTAVEQPFAEGPWIHPSDAAKAPPGVEGGWHDAGDFSIYNNSLNEAVFWLLLAAADFHPRDDDMHLPESRNGVPDLLDEARWGLKWLLSVQAKDGGFPNSTCQQSYGAYGTNTPQGVPPYHAGEVGTLATARGVGTLAFAAWAFREVDPAFSRRCLEAARRGMQFLDLRPTENSDGPSCPIARRDGDAEVGRQVRLYAAAGMALATDERRFHEAFAELYTEPRYDLPMLHLDGHASLIYLHVADADPRTRARILAPLERLAAEARRDGATHPFGTAMRYWWGSLGGAFTRAAMFSAPRCLADPDRAVDDCEQAVASLHYAFGRNSLRFCYVSGIPGVERGASGGFNHWLAALDAHPRNFPGIVAGGPNIYPDQADRSYPHARPRPVWGYWADPAMPRDGDRPVDARYTDNDSWCTNEPTVGWQSEAVYVLQMARWLAARRPSPGASR
jgi:endoglucanase